MFQARTSVRFFFCVCESGIIFIIEAPMSLQAAYKTKCKTHLLPFLVNTTVSRHLISSAFREYALLTTLLPSNFSPFYATKRDREPRSFPEDLSHPSHLWLTHTRHVCMVCNGNLTLWLLQILKAIWREYAVCYGSLLLTLSHVRHCTELMMVPSNISEMTLLYFLCCFFLFGDADWARIKRT